MTSKIHKSLIIIVSFFLKLPHQIYASGCPTPDPTLWPTPPAFSLCEEYPFAFGGTRTIGNFIAPFLYTAIIGAGLVSFILIVGAGVTMIASAGDKQAQEKGKNAITAGVIGLVLVFAAYWIIEIIQVLTGIDILQPNL